MKCKFCEWSIEHDNSWTQGRLRSHVWVVHPEHRAAVREFQAALRDLDAKIKYLSRGEYGGY